MVTVRRGPFLREGRCWEYKMTTTPWPLQQATPAAAGSWTLFIIRPFASNPQVVSNSEELWCTAGGLCWPLMPQPEQASMAHTFRLSTAAIWHRLWSNEGVFLPSMEVPGASLGHMGVTERSFTEQFKRKCVKLNESTLKISHFILRKFNLKRKINWKKKGQRRKGKQTSQETKWLKEPGKSPKGILCGSKGFPSLPSLL